MSHLEAANEANKYIAVRLEQKGNSISKSIKLFVIKSDLVIKLFIKLVVFTDGREWVCPRGSGGYKFVMRGLKEGL